MFDSFLRSEVSRLELPGLAVTITQQGQELFAAGYGHCDLAGKKPITPDTRFGIASVTKLVTAIATMRLQEQGRLSVNDSVNQYYPGLNVASDTRMQLRHLLSHSTGLPGLPTRFFAANLLNDEDSSGGIDIDRSVGTDTNLPPDAMLRNPRDLSGFINKLGIVPLAPPGTLLNYSNESFCLLGGIIEQLTAEPYQQHVVNSVFRPLGMTDSLVGYNANNNNNFALPLVRDKSELREAGIWDAPLFYPAGGIISSARDLTRLISVLSDENNFLSNESRQALRRPEITVASRPEPSIGYGYGLEYQFLDKDSALHWHTGQRAGLSSFVGWVSGPNIAVSVLSQITDAPLAGIGFALLAKLLNQKDVVWPQLSANIASKPDKNTPVEIDHFQGRYFTPEGFDFRVNTMGRTLFLMSNDHTPPKPFYFFDKQSGLVGEQNFRFLMKEVTDIKPWALALDLRILPQA